jgi:hypothetical protein
MLFTGFGQSVSNKTLPSVFKIIIIIIIMRGSYIAHFTNVLMRFTTSGGLFRAALIGLMAAVSTFKTSGKVFSQYGPPSC